MRHGITLPVADVGLERYIERAFPGGRVLAAQRLTGGLRNASFRLRLDSAAEDFVLRIYEHDPVLCQKELDVMRLVAGSVPVPEVVYAEPAGSPPFAVLRWVEGITFRELRGRGDREAIAEASRSIGEALAAVHRVRFAKGGWLTAGPEVSWPLMEGEHAMTRFVDGCLESAILQARVPQRVRASVHELMWSRRDELAMCEEQTQLVHGDFGKRNVLVRESAGRWEVAAILDWEFAVAGTPLSDLGNFLRYERASRPPSEPFFSDGYRSAGGVLPEGWRGLIRVVDLVALFELLTREALPDDVAAEIAELVAATVESREPQV